jgi:hypothetical protein
VGHETEVPRHGLADDQHIISTDWCSLRGKQRAERARLPSVLLVELEHRKLKGIDQGQILRGATALERAIRQLSCTTIAGIATSSGFSRRRRWAAFEVLSFSKVMTAFASSR